MGVICISAEVLGVLINSVLKCQNLGETDTVTTDKIFIYMIAFAHSLLHDSQFGIHRYF